MANDCPQGILIKQFARDFAQAQDRTEWAEFVGGAIFEIVLSEVIVGLTGGLGVAAVAAKSTRHVGKLADLGKVLKTLADKLKAAIYGYSPKPGKGLD